MAQYDVYPNPSPRSKQHIPYLVDVQSGLLEGLRTRFVIPLSRVGIDMAGAPRKLVPLVKVKGETLALHAHQAAAVEANALKRRVASLSDHAFEIRDALDAVISGI